jgi:hypothetical protein
MRPAQLLLPNNGALHLPMPASLTASAIRDTSSQTSRAGTHASNSPPGY